jgi:hypothetical protein
MNFIKSDHRNRLGEEHLNHTIRLFTSEYELDNFPYDTAPEILIARKNRRGVGLTGGQRGNAGITGALDLDLMAQAIRDNEWYFHGVTEQLGDHRLVGGALENMQDMCK